jgi:hypothetical protein
VNISVINANSVANLLQHNERIIGQVVVKYERGGIRPEYPSSAADGPAYRSVN